MTIFSTSNIVLSDVGNVFDDIPLYIWDANAGGAGRTDGAGAWLGANQWWTGTTNITWVSGNAARFGVGGSGGAVTLASPTSVSYIAFKSFGAATTYTIGSAGQTITINRGIGKDNGNGNVLIISPLVFSGPQRWVNNTSFSSFTPALALGNGANITTVDNGGYDFEVGGTGYTQMKYTNISGNGGLIKTGTGIAELSGQYSTPTHGYTGTTTINGGVLWVTFPQLPSGNITINSGTLHEYYANNLTRTLGSGVGQIQILTGTSGFAVGNSGTITFNNDAAFEVQWGSSYFNPTIFQLQDEYASSAPITIANKFDLNNATRTIYVVGSTNSATISGIIRTSSGTAGLTKTGTGKLILNGANTINGNLNITGTLQIGTNASANNAAINSTTYNGNIVINASSVLDIQTNTTMTLGGIISGAGSIIKRYSGTLTLSGNNTYTGTTSIVPITAGGGGGTVTVTSFNSINGGSPPLASSSLGRPTDSTNGTITVGNGSIQAGVVLKYTGTGETTDRVIAFGLNNNSTQSLDASNASGLLRFTSAFTVGGSISTSTSITFTGTGNGQVDLGLPSGVYSIAKGGAGTWTLNGDSVNTGGVSAQGGNLYLNGLNSYTGQTVCNCSVYINTIKNYGVNCSVGKGTAGTAIQVGGNGSGPTLIYTGSGDTTDRQIMIGYSGNTSGGTIYNNGTGALTFTANPFNINAGIVASARSMQLGGSYTGAPNEIQGAIVYATKSINDIAITKVDACTWILSGVNTFTGGITLNASSGTLQISGSGSLGSGYYYSNILINSSSIFKYSSSATQFFCGAITGSGSLVKDTNNSVITFTGANSYSGGTTISSGTLYIASSANHSSSGSITAAGTIKIGAGSSGRTISNSIVLTGGTIIGVQENVGSGGNIIIDGNGVTHIFTASGSLVLPSNVTANELIVGGGGGAGGGTNSVVYQAGGGGGQVLNLTSQALSAGTLTITVGTGGIAGNNTDGGNGGASSISGGSTAAGGLGAKVSPTTGTGGTSGSGKVGGNRNGTQGGGGGGGDSAVGGNAVTNAIGGAGGAGSANTAITGLATYTYGQVSGGVAYFGGGGGGGDNQTTGGAGGLGGGGSSGVGVANTGGGGGSANAGGLYAGAAGIVIVQYPYSESAGTLTLSGTIDLQSNSIIDAYLSGGVISITNTISTSTGTGGLTIASSSTSGGIVQLSGSNTYSGNTTVSNGATLRWGANNVIPNASNIIVGNSTLNVQTYTDTVGTLQVNGTATINIGSGGALVFADSSGVTWSGSTLTITGTFVSGSSLKFGTTSGGLTAGQLLKFVCSGYTTFSLNANGYLTAS